MALVKAESVAAGIDFWLPPLDDERTEKVFVFEVGDTIVGALVFRRVWDMMMIAEDPLAVAAAFRYEGRLREVLDRAGVDVMNAWIPAKLMEQTNPKKKPAMQRFMERFKFRKVEKFVAFEGEVRE